MSAGAHSRGAKKGTTAAHRAARPQALVFHRPGRWFWVGGPLLLVGALTVALGAQSLDRRRSSAPSVPARAVFPTTSVPPSTTTLPPVEPVSSLPANGATGVSVSQAVSITFSGPVPRGEPDPALTPAAAGTWSVSGTTMTFTPSAGFLPSTVEHVAVPAGPGVVKGTTVSFTTTTGSLLRLQQLLAELGYLPLGFGPAGLGAEPTVADQVPTTPQVGDLTWRFANVPASLSALWAQGQSNEITRGAVMAFESDHGLSTDGVAGPAVWQALVAAVAARQGDPHPYDYLMVSETQPERLVVWRDGSDVYSSLANTGVAGATTQTGTWPVYLRYSSTTMAGTNPNGTKYDDKGVPWVAYFNGSDAVHGFVRASYGWPQSNGCVELPVSNAASVWTMDPIGTLVTVAS
jgi:peptidoglycan hydrolase-like protein with peptidoglycan-binding domain